MSTDIWEKLTKCEGFDWDKGNSDKNWNKHKVGKVESEQIFFNFPLIVVHDEIHSIKEQRFLALGITDNSRHLVVIFTLRKGKLIRVISARDMNKKERNNYEQESKKDT